jgi:hypothetical protein
MLGGVRYLSWAVRRSFLGVRYFFLDGTPLMKPHRLVLHGRYAICCSGAGSIFQDAKTGFHLVGRRDTRQDRCYVLHLLFLFVDLVGAGILRSVTRLVFHLWNF